MALNGRGAAARWCGRHLDQGWARSRRTSIKGGPDQDGVGSSVGPLAAGFDQAWAHADRARSSLGPIETAPRSGLGGHADRVEGGLEASDRAIDVAELVEAEQPDAERREVLGFAALQGNS